MSDRALARRVMFLIALDHIEAAYRLATKAHTDRPKEIEREYRARLGIAPDDPWPDPDESNDDDPIARAYDDIETATTSAWHGSNVVRSAFLIALFQHWERYVCSTLSLPSYEHPKQWLVDRVGLEVANSIRDLHKIANCAKHGPGHSCRRLKQLRPELFQLPPALLPHLPPRLVITSDLLDRVFADVRKAAG